MWALFYQGERVSRLFASRTLAQRAARHSGFYDGDQLMESYEIRPVR